MIQRWMPIGLLLLLWACGPTSSVSGTEEINEESFSLSPTSPLVDTVYVARFRPISVTYVSRLDSLVITASSSGPNRRQAATTSTEESATEVSFGGFVMNETRSVIGDDFYDAFYSQWEAPDEASHFTVRIEEQPVPRFGTRVIVRVEETEVFQSYLKPRTREIEQAAREAVSRAGLYLQKYHRPRSVY